MFNVQATTTNPRPSSCMAASAGHHLWSGRRHLGARSPTSTARHHQSRAIDEAIRYRRSSSESSGFGAGRPLPQTSSRPRPVRPYPAVSQPIHLGDLNARIETPGSPAASAGELSRYLDEVTDAGLPFIVRNEAYQPPRLEVDTAVLRGLAARGS